MGWTELGVSGKPSPMRRNDSGCVRTARPQLGPYLSAGALMDASPDDETLKARVDGIVAVLAQCQASDGLKTLKL